MSFTEFPFFRSHELRLVDRFGRRDSAWNGAYGLAREALAVQGVRCFACGRKIWSRDGTRRLYCDDTCKARSNARSKRFRKFLREAGHGCAFCGCPVPENGHAMVTENPAQAPTPPDATGRDE